MQGPPILVKTAQSNEYSTGVTAFSQLAGDLRTNHKPPHSCWEAMLQLNPPQPYPSHLKETKITSGVRGYQIIDHKYMYFDSLKLTYEGHEFGYVRRP